MSTNSPLSLSPTIRDSSSYSVSQPYVLRAHSQVLSSRVHIPLRRLLTDLLNDTSEVSSARHQTHTQTDVVPSALVDRRMDTHTMLR